METIFDLGVTEKEIEQCGFYDAWQNVRHDNLFTTPITEESYLEESTVESALLDIIHLLEYRGEDTSGYRSRLSE